MPHQRPPVRQDLGWLSWLLRSRARHRCPGHVSIPECRRRLPCCRPGWPGTAASGGSGLTLRSRGSPTAQPLSRTITAAIPPVFDAYATVVVPDGDEERKQRDLAVSALLSEQSAGQPWWLGYLDTGVDDILFPGIPMVTLYSGWRYVLVEAGPEQAATWRENDPGSYGGLAQLDVPRRPIVAGFHAVGRRLELHRRTRWTRRQIPQPPGPPGQAGHARPRRHTTRSPGAVTQPANDPGVEEDLAKSRVIAAQACCYSSALGLGHTEE